MLYKFSKPTFKNWKDRYKCDYLSTIKRSPRLQSNQYFGMQQATYHHLITLFDSLFQVLRTSTWSNTVCWLQNPVSKKKREGMSHHELRQKADMGKIRLQNVNEVSHFKPLLLDVEMYKLDYWAENMKKPGR